MERSDMSVSSTERGAFVVAVPSVGEGGLDARRSHHFGKSPCFTAVELAAGKIERVDVIANGSHSEGGCQAAAQLLASAGVNALVAGGIGARPLAILSEADIDVYFDRQRKTVGEAVAALAAGELQPIATAQICNHHRGQEHGDSC
jgi:predicted Fe-Mo cluster-binding NifX family protein